MNKIKLYDLMKKSPWKKVRENSRKNGKRGKNTKIVSKSSIFAKKHLVAETQQGVFYVYTSFLLSLKCFIDKITIIVPISGKTAVTSIPALRPNCSVVRLSFALKSTTV